MVIAIILGIPVVLIVLMLVFVAVRNHMAYYTPANCSVCGANTGVKGSKRYKLADGCMCQTCAEKFIVNTGNLSGLGPNAFASHSVEKVRERIVRRAEMGEEAWRKWVLEQPGPVIVHPTTEKKPVAPTMRCPRCGSTQISANQKGFGVGKAVVGAAVTGSALGLAAGAVGSKKVIITCLNCGHQWQAGKK